jgi:DNA-binding NtrC family response regulator
MAQPWKGNVRELQHAVERAVILARREVLEPDDLATTESPGAPAAAGGVGGETLEAVLDRCTREHVVAVLDRVGWRKQEAANALGVDRVTLYRLIRKFSLDEKRGGG